MTGSNTPRGFSLLIAVILAAAAASITIALSTLAYKNVLLASTALESQFAFYSADTALECALYADNQLASFPYAATPGNVNTSCAGVAVTLTGSTYNSHTTMYQSGWFAVNGVDCARITVYKTDGSVTPVASLFGDGVNVACAAIGTDPRTIERGLKALY